ncbi:MAG: hypothetical protein FWG12_00850 [Holophagaceae bacterium]|nr:hypothetical protein [Holophagaceae bacterium]
MKSKIKSSLIAGTILASGGALVAQDSFVNRLSVSGSVDWAADSLASITHVGTAWWNVGAGYNFNIGYTGSFAGTDIPYRASLGVNYFPGGRSGGYGPAYGEPGHGTTNVAPRNTLLGYQLATDLYVDLKRFENIKFLVGLSVNTWHVNQDIWVTGIGYTKNHDAFSNIPGLKLGGRIGFEYQYSDKVAIELLYQLCELGHSHAVVRANDVDEDGKITTEYMPDYGPKAWNPAWLQLGVKYRF